LPHNLLGRLFRIAAGRVRFQRWFEELHRASLIGMNYGGGTDFQSSGERQALEHVRRVLCAKRKPPYIIFDVGAHQGGYTRLLLEIFASDAVVHSFEPSSAMFTILTRELGNRSRLHRLGLGERNGTFTLHFNPQYPGLSSLYQRKLGHLGMTLDCSEDVPVSTVESFCRAEGIPRIHLLKLDVEGHELRVLQGAQPLLQTGAIDFIQFEFGGCNIDSRTYFRDFYELLTPRYRIFRIVRDGLDPVLAYRETDEIFTTTNYLCESAAL
jgi:FkbM family methyltransferase